MDTEVFTCDCDGDFCGPLCGDTPANNCGLLAGSEGAAANTAVLGGIGALVGLLLLLVVAMVFVIRRRNRNIIIPEAMPIVPREKPDEWEIEPRSLLTIGKLIGEGHFGSVSPTESYWSLLTYCAIGTQGALLGPGSSRRLTCHRCCHQIAQGCWGRDTGRNRFLV